MFINIEDCSESSMKSLNKFYEKTKKNLEFQELILLPYSDKKIDETIINTFQIKDETILTEYYINYIYCSLFIILFILIIVIIEKIYMTIKKQHN